MTPDAEGPQGVGPLAGPEYPAGEGELISWGPSTIAWVLELVRTAALVAIAVALIVIA